MSFEEISDKNIMTMLEWIKFLVGMFFLFIPRLSILTSFFNGCDLNVGLVTYFGVNTEKPLPPAILYMLKMLQALSEKSKKAYHKY